MKYKIEKNVKLPVDARFKKLRGKPKAVKTPSSRETYPFSQMEVGYSFVVPGKTVRDLRGATASAKKRYNRVFIGRTSPTGKVRIWRAA